MGALNVVWRKCGKPNCACAQPGHRGHGPQYNLTRRIDGKTVNVHLKPGPELAKAEREVARHQRFAALVEEVTAVSDGLHLTYTPAGIVLDRLTQVQRTILAHLDIPLPWPEKPA